EILGPQVNDRDFGLFLLPGIAAGQAPEGICEVVVHTAAGGGQKLEQVGQQQAGQGGVIAAEAEEGPLLPVVQPLARFLTVVAGGLLEQAQMDTLAVRHLPLRAYMTGAGLYGGDQGLLFGDRLFSATDQFQGVEAAPQGGLGPAPLLGQAPATHLIDRRYEG